MNKNLKVEKSVTIDADPQKVWEALTNPELIKKYFFGTETITDWKVGSAITFQGEFQGKSYKDKGNIITIEENKHIQYTYWSGFSGLEDKPENYSTVAYSIDANDNQTVLTVTQIGFANEQAQKHSENAWTSILSNIKQVVETK